MADETVAGSDIDTIPPPKPQAPQAGFTTKFGFWMRLLCYLVIGISAAIAAAATASMIKNFKNLSNNRNSCPISYDWDKDEQKRASTCGFVQFISIYSTVVAWVLLLFAAYKVYNSSFKLRKSVTIELILAVFAVIMGITAAALTSSGRKAWCDRTNTDNAKSCMDRTEANNTNEEFNKSIRNMILVEQTLWVAVVTWVVLTAILLWRACAAWKKPDDSNMNFDNPNAKPEQPSVV
eukprot:TRINITY_DN10394_c0_g2_i1.p1 TRINITY_DN10394_c0_g2~~TRINITY_DN10394_c0_g2_i1.p1  ORF type:complete len:250 (+),score=44.94 TRINITY_DN10394_c0_g2_i1:44-751(+)